MKLEGGLQFDTFKRLLLAMAQQRSVAHLLELVTDQLAATQDVALVRIWLLGPGAGCEICREAAHCSDHRKCLSLVSSQGCSIVDKNVWSHTDGAFRRIPLGVRKVGRIALTGQPLEVMEIGEEADWIADHAWVKREGIVGFAGQPLVHRGDVLGVLAFFTRVRMDPDTISMLRMVADHLASALVNAWSFEEIERLKKQIEMENAYLRKEVDTASAAGVLIGVSPAMQHLRRRIELVAPTDANVLITGESGTGKEVVAREIHARSSRRERPMIKINCAAVPKELFESEFFGHAKGSFTGAARERFGLFQTADGGTLFLDEVSEIPVALQSKLLRVLQEGEYRRVGEEHDRKVNVRVISATNRNLPGEIRAGSFREDLYYRLQVFPFEIPPLRERRDDIPPLAAHFVEQAARRHQRRHVTLRTADVGRLSSYDWPGNCRELQNVLERAVITAQGGRLNLELPTLTPENPRRSPGGGSEPARILTEEEMRDLERQNTVAALERCHWKIYGPDGAGELLGVRPTTLVSRLKQMGIARRDGKRGGGGMA
jgi:transcriptional regulator with GAF, ATPase, and Fis domain